MQQKRYKQTYAHAPLQMVIFPIFFRLHIRTMMRTSANRVAKRLSTALRPDTMEYIHAPMISHIKDNHSCSEEGDIYVHMSYAIHRSRIAAEVTRKLRQYIYIYTFDVPCTGPMQMHINLCRATDKTCTAAGKNIWISGHIVVWIYTWAMSHTCPAQQHYKCRPYHGIHIRMCLVRNRPDTFEENGPTMQYFIMVSLWPRFRSTEFLGSETMVKSYHGMLIDVFSLFL